MKFRARLMCQILFIVFVCQSFISGVSANILESQPNIIRVGEMTEFRDYKSTVYKLSNGQYEWVGYPDDINYLDKNGDFQVIDNRLINDTTNQPDSLYKYRNTSNSYIAKFSDINSDNKFLYIDYTGKIIYYGLENANYSCATLIEGEAESPYLQYNPAGFIRYNNVYPNIDIIYSTETHCIKEYLILNEHVDTNQFTFNIECSNLKISNENGIISFVDENDKVIYQIGNLYAIDNNGERTNDINCDLVNSNGKDKIVLTISKDYLSDANRSYPIIVDPSIIITGSSKTYDTYVSSRYASDNFYLDTWLGTGRNSDLYTRRIYINFELPTYIPSGYVTSAYMRIEKKNGATPNIKAYRVTQTWSSSSVTWNTKPGYSTTETSSTAYNDSGNWWRMDATSLVCSWLNGTYSKYGFLIRDATESGTSQWTDYYSSDYSIPADQPQLCIVFSQYTSRSYIFEGSPNINCAGYALNYPYWVNFGITTEELNNCANEAALYSYTKSKIDSYLDGANINHSFLSTYMSYISSGKWRVVWRMGYEDSNGNGLIDIGLFKDSYDFHWWFESSTGQWAQKSAQNASSLISGTSATSDPDSIAWPLYPYSDFYDSTCNYFSIWD